MHLLSGPPARYCWKIACAASSADATKEIKNVDGGGGRRRELRVPRTILFVDEIPPVHKAQQDAFLPYVDEDNSVDRSDDGEPFV